VAQGEGHQHTNHAFRKCFSFSKNAERKTEVDVEDMKLGFTILHRSLSIPIAMGEREKEGEVNKSVKN
jgi:hypothetical protein